MPSLHDFEAQSIQGEPIRLSHKVEPTKLQSLPGEQRFYLPYTQLHEELRSIVGGKGRVDLGERIRALARMVSASLSPEIQLRLTGDTDKTFVEAAVWGINAFDQWGVELGKTLAGQLLPSIEGAESASGHDASTAGLVEAIGYFRRY